MVLALAALVIFWIPATSGWAWLPATLSYGATISMIAYAGVMSLFSK